MEMAKSFFGSRDHDGYVGKDEHTVSATINPLIKRRKSEIQCCCHPRNIAFIDLFLMRCSFNGTFFLFRFM